MSEDSLVTKEDLKLAEPYEVAGIVIIPKPPRFRSGRAMRAGYGEGTTDRLRETTVSAAANAIVDQVEKALLLRKDSQDGETPAGDLGTIRTGNTSRPLKFECTPLRE